HQSFELTCPAGDGPLDRVRLDDLVAVFHREHRRLYTYDLPHAPVELVNLRVTAIGRPPQRATPAPPMPEADPSAAIPGRRPVYLASGDAVGCPCYARDRLAPGMRFDGPAVVDQPDATTLVAPHFTARVDAVLNLVLERS